MHDKIAWLIKHIPFIQWLYQKVMSLVFRVMGLFISVDDKLVLLSSYGGDQYSDSPKVIFEAMKTDSRFTGYHFVWAFGDPSKFDVPGADKVKIDTLSYFKTALRAKVWITNVNIERGLHFKKKSQVYLNTWHGNGMAYDSKRKKLVVIAREHRKQEITLIDAKTLRITKQKNAKYHNKINAGSAELNARYKKSGLAAIAYVKKYDCYVAFEREHHNLLIFDPDTFECIGLAYTNLGSKYPGTFQAMDADEKYVYLLLSYYNKSQPYNLILALDWNSENLLPAVNACKSKDPTFVEHYWYCNNKQNGKPDAVIRLKTKHEAENIYHTKKNGKEHFYLAEYYGHIAYKKVGRRKMSYFKRDNYVYDLGII